MGNSYSQLLGLVGPFGHESRVRAWLHNASQDRVLEALQAKFYPRANAFGGLLGAIRPENVTIIRDIFKGHAKTESGHEVWEKRQFSNFLHIQFPGVISNSVIEMLWRSFLFHAYFPFPVESRLVDYSAFQRAIGFLAAEATMYLGEDAEGAMMDGDRYPNAKARQIARNERRLWVLFKSLAIAHPCLEGKNVPQRSEVDSINIEEDIIDVLALAQPSHPCIMSPPYETLRPYAENLASGYPSEAIYYSLSQLDFMDLMEVLLSIQLVKSKGLAREDQVSAAQTLARRFDFERDEPFGVQWHTFRKVLDVYLPNFLLKFRLIFTSFLYARQQPQNHADRPPLNVLSSEHAQCLSLFLYPSLAPAAVSSGTERQHETNARFEAICALSTASLIYSASPESFSSASLIECLQMRDTATVLLITGGMDIANNADPAVKIKLKRAIFGAYMPTSWDLKREQRYKAIPTRRWYTYAAPHTLFQLQPSLEIFYPDYDAWIMDLISITITDKGQGRKGGLNFGESSSTGLSIDFDTGIASMRSKPTATQDTSTPEAEDPEKQCQSEASSYYDIGRKYNISTSAWETVMRIQKFEVFDLGGEVSKTFDAEEHAKVQDTFPSKFQKVDPKSLRSDEEVERRAAAARKEQPKVEEDVLKGRIEGYGPGSAKE